MPLRFGWFLFALLSASSIWAATDDSPVAAAQSLFYAMKAHDTAAITALFVPGATLASMDAEGKIVITPADKWAERIGANKNLLVERMHNPKVLEHGPIAVLWAEYDFHLNGTLTHCGIDLFNLLKTGGSWKITAISFTSETTGCAADVKQ